MEFGRRLVRSHVGALVSLVRPQAACTLEIFFSPVQRMSYSNSRTKRLVATAWMPIREQNAFSAVFSTEGRVVVLYWAKLKPQGQGTEYGVGAGHPGRRGDLQSLVQQDGPTAARLGGAGMHPNRILLSLKCSVLFHASTAQCSLRLRWEPKGRFSAEVVDGQGVCRRLMRAAIGSPPL